MSCYISSNNNRFYVETETSYGQAPLIGDDNRIPAIKLAAKQVAERSDRKDKTGGRTFVGLPAGTRKRTSFELKTYLTGWDDQSQQPGYGPLFQAGMGMAPALFAGGTIGSAINPTRFQFASAHGLTAGQAVVFGGEMRFVVAVVSDLIIDVNVAFTIQPSAGSPMGPAITYRLANDLPSVSVFDYWDPADAVQRVLTGAAVNKLAVKVNGDFHEFAFSGPARDLVDSGSFQSGQAGLAEYPLEPVLSPFNYAVIPGHLGQAWLGSTPQRFYSLTDAELVLDNNIDTRNREFGTDGPTCISAGRRTVSLDMSLYQHDDSATIGLYQAAKQRSPISTMFQLGQQAGQLFGMYLKSVVPEVPEYDDSESRVQWRFHNCRAQGTADDEVVLAFG
ncbi:MAG: hypothetical protein ABJF23_21150 [Bryobacteraceae bacterium]